MTAVQKEGRRKKTAHDRDIMWWIVKEVLYNNPHATDEEVTQRVWDSFTLEVQPWLLSEARFVYSRKVERGEFPPPGGFTNQESVKDAFKRLSVQDRILFADWARHMVSSQ